MNDTWYGICSFINPCKNKYKNIEYFKRNKPMTFSIKTNEKGNSAEIELQGVVDVYVSPNFRDELLLVCNKEINEVTIDLSGVSFMDSSGVATLVEGLKWGKKEGKSFILKNVGINVMNALFLTKLEKLFKIIPKVDHLECFS